MSDPERGCIGRRVPGKDAAPNFVPGTGCGGIVHPDHELFFFCPVVDDEWVDLVGDDI